jgi:hypothetical protein
MDRAVLEERFHRQMERLERRETRRTARDLAYAHVTAELAPLLLRPPPQDLSPALQAIYREEVHRLVARVAYRKAPKALPPPAPLA